MTPVFSGRAKLAISLAKYGFALCGFVPLLAMRQEVAEETRQRA